MDRLEFGRAKRRLALKLWDIGAVHISGSDEEGVVMKLHEKKPEAVRSPIYFNLRTPEHPKKPGLLTPEVVADIAECMKYIVDEAHVEFDAVAPIPWAGDPFAGAFTQLTKEKILIPLGKWEHAEKRRITGPDPKRPIPLWVKKILVMDDLITGADSKEETLQLLRELDYEVTDVVVTIDREQGGRTKLEAFDCKLHTIFTMTELLDFYVHDHKMDPELRSNIHLYLAHAQE